jgi:hypothetical protein
MTIATKSEECTYIEHDGEKMMKEDEIGEREKGRKGKRYAVCMVVVASN